MKVCTKCFISKPITEYHKKLSGYCSHCKPCTLLYRLANKDKKAAREKIWYEKNKHIIIPKKSKYKAERVLTDPFFLMQKNIRNLIRMAHKRKNISKRNNTQNILGCDFNTLFAHLKQTAINNYGGWHARIAYHIDHIVPLKTAITEEDVIRLNHYSNLQYLTPEDNLKKGSRPWSQDLFSQKPQLP